MKRNTAFETLFALIVLAFSSFASSCATTEAGGKVSPFVPVATFTSNGAVLADVRSNFDVTVVKAQADGIAGIRDGYTGVWVMPPRIVQQGFVYVWRRTPKFDGKFSPHDPLPAWVETAPGLWLPGEAATLGYTFETTNQ